MLLWTVVVLFSTWYVIVLVHVTTIVSRSATWTFRKRRWLVGFELNTKREHFGGCAGNGFLWQRRVVRLRFAAYINNIVMQPGLNLCRKREINVRFEWLSRHRNTHRFTVTDIVECTYENLIFVFRLGQNVMAERSNKELKKKRKIWSWPSDYCVT